MPKTSSPKLLKYRSQINTTKASILIVALWSVCLLSVFAVSMGYIVRQRIVLASRLDERDRAHFVADAGIKKAISELKNEEAKSYECLGDTWSNDPAAFKDIGFNAGVFSVSYDYRDEKTGMGFVRYGMVDEESKININKAEAKTLERLFRIVLGLTETEAQELAASIVDWRDADSELSLPFGSAEDSDYTGLNYPYGAKDANFEVPDELLLVKGMNEDIFNKIKSFITIYGEGRININTAPKAVLMAVGLDKDTADKIIDFRYGKDGILGTLDDNIFDSEGNIIPQLDQFATLSDSEAAYLSQITDRYLNVRSNNFTALSNVSMFNKKDTKRITCVVNRSGKIFYWREA